MIETLKEKILKLQTVSEALEPSEMERKNYVEEVNHYADKFINDFIEAWVKIMNSDRFDLKLN